MRTLILAHRISSGEIIDKSIRMAASDSQHADALPSHRGGYSLSMVNEHSSHRNGGPARRHALAAGLCVLSVVAISCRARALEPDHAKQFRADTSVNGP